MPQMQSEDCMMIYYKRRYEDAQRELRAQRLETELAAAAAVDARAAAAHDVAELHHTNEQLMRQHALLLAQLADFRQYGNQRAVRSEYHARLLQRELAAVSLPSCYMV